LFAKWTATTRPPPFTVRGEELECLTEAHIAPVDNIGPVSGRAPPTAELTRLLKLKPKTLLL
jgi:hypothetical protein